MNAGVGKLRRVEVSTALGEGNQLPVRAVSAQG